MFIKSNEQTVHIYLDKLSPIAHIKKKCIQT